MQTLRSKIERVAGWTVLLEGESGVGKELVARQIHELSRRRHGPFVAVNCAALVETLLEAELFGIEERTATGVKGRRGKFEAADGGTLFLDEVSDLSLSAQAKLLRAIQDLTVERVGGHAARRIDTRIVAATNRPLHPLVDRQLFRADLYYRLSGVDIRVRRCRKRRADIWSSHAIFSPATPGHPVVASFRRGDRCPGRGMAGPAIASARTVDGTGGRSPRPMSSSSTICRRRCEGDYATNDGTIARSAGNPSHVGQPLRSPRARSHQGQQARSMRVPGQLSTRCRPICATGLTMAPQCVLRGALVRG